MLALREQAFGSEHAYTAITMAHLGRVLKDVGKLDEAEVMFHRAFVNNERDGKDPQYSTYLQGCIGGVLMLKGTSCVGGTAAEGRKALEGAIASLTSMTELDVDKQRNVDKFIKRLQVFLTQSGPTFSLE